MNKPAFRVFEFQLRPQTSWSRNELSLLCPVWPAESVSIIHSCFYATTFCGNLLGSHSNWKFTKWVIRYQAVDRQVVPFSADGFKGPVFKSVGGWGSWGEGMTSRIVSQVPFSSLQTAASHLPPFSQCPHLPNHPGLKPQNVFVFSFPFTLLGLSWWLRW